jgi:hypothetical protein
MTNKYPFTINQSQSFLLIQTETVPTEETTRQITVSLRYNAGSWGSFMGGFDSFTLAVLGSAIVVIVVFALMIFLDKGKPPAPPVLSAPAKVTPAKVAPAKVAGKR